MSVVSVLAAMTSGQPAARLLSARHKLMAAGQKMMRNHAMERGCRRRGLVMVDGMTSVGTSLQIVIIEDFAWFPTVMISLKLALAANKKFHSTDQQNLELTNLRAYLLVLLMSHLRYPIFAPVGVISPQYEVPASLT
ncbi:hypothetical protein Y032_0118g769 [Ancylostoma ceylanicum]|nr:hypothetical protein Y032_0118g769 [Ancylostoma ceylanicum]